MDIVPEGIIRLTREQAETAIEVLEAAFLNYPSLKYYFPDDPARKRITRYFVSYPVYTGIKYGLAYAVSPALEGVAVWMPPGSYPLSFWQSLRSVPLSVYWGFGRYGGNLMRQLGQHVDSVHSRLAGLPHWYLYILGVKPELKGKGYSSRLLKPMLRKIEETGLPCYLETLDEYNVNIYEHLGFTVIDRSTVPGTDLVNWAMLRKKKE